MAWRTNKLNAWLVSTVISAHLLFLLWQSSILGDIISRVLTHQYVVHTVLLSIAVVLGIISGRAERMTRSWSMAASTCIVYGIFVILASLHLPMSIDATCQILLVPLTIVALTFSAPLLLDSGHYRPIIMGLALLLSLHSLLTIILMATGAKYLFGREIISELGRAKSLFGKTLPQTNGLYVNPNAIGSFLLFFPAVFLSEWMRQRTKKGQALIASALLPIIMAVVVSFSRASQLTGLSLY